MKLFIGIFLAVGLGLLTGAFYSYKHTATFLESAISTEGTVVENRYEAGSSSNDSGSYHAYIKYSSLDGSDVTFRSSVGTNPPSFKVGEQVKVYYDPQDSQNAQVGTFFQMWFLPVLLGGMGFIFSSIPLGILFSMARGSQREAWLRQNGSRILSKYVGVEMDRSLSVNGQHPYIIKTQWLNPTTNQVHVFKSKRLWFDPEEYVKDAELPVYIDRNNPSKYCVDISMLPKQA